MVKVEVIPTVNEVHWEEIYHKTVIVVDVLRSSSTIVTALARGFREIVPVETIGQAQQLYTEETYLAGERFGKKIQGFHFSNSPGEVEKVDEIRPTLILTTTNGTKAIQKANKSETLLIGCLLNGAACAARAAELKQDVTILSPGSRQFFAFEDGLAAGLIISEIRDKCSDLCLNDMGMAMEAAYLHCRENICEILEQTATGKRLIQMGLKEDVERCSRINSSGLIPVLQKDRIIAACP